MRNGFTHNYAEQRYVERFTATQCSEKVSHYAQLRIISLRTREDLGSRAVWPLRNAVLRWGHSPGESRYPAPHYCNSMSPVRSQIK